MENLQKLALPLRFPEFTQNLRQRNLGDIAKFLKGKGISKSDIKEDGINECIRYGELYTHYKETISNILSKTNKSKDESVLSQKNDIIIPSSGETQLDIATASCVMKPNVILGGDLNIIRSNEDGVYLSYYLNSRKKIDIAKLSQGNSVVHLYAKQLSTLKINLPEFSEQKKIATFLSSVDEKINQLQKKKELLDHYKKGMMQKIFKQEIRFKGENGKDFPNWKKRYYFRFWIFLLWKKCSKVFTFTRCPYSMCTIRRTL
ncbi:restriction endonuclease subunit S [uncultured Christiangramia sp.]|uniref:restriction endonuclease subunit S n=1 Tax=Christiangramia sp. 3-2217-3z TaxID=3417564 RepID=UPI00262A25D3|nr:restriction endonuclease subunit S [uncultured Christiangramia sp.]